MSEVLTVALPWIQAFWIVKLYQSVNGYHSFQATMSLQNVSSYEQSTWHNFADKMNLHEQHRYCLSIPNIFQQRIRHSIS